MILQRYFVFCNYYDVFEFSNNHYRINILITILIKKLIFLYFSDLMYNNLVLKWIIVSMCRYCVNRLTIFKCYRYILYYSAFDFREITPSKPVTCCKVVVTFSNTKYSLISNVINTNIVKTPWNLRHNYYIIQVDNLWKFLCF